MRFSVLAIILALSLCSCKKYEEGPYFSFRSKTKRLEGSWQIMKWTIDGTEQDLSQTSWRLNIHRSGNYDKFITYNIPPLPVTIDSEQGSWVFDKKKEHVEFSESTSGVVTIQEIVKLYNKEIKLRYNDGTSVHVFEYSLIQ